MAPRGARRQAYVDEYTEDSDSSSYKRRRKDKTRDESEETIESISPHVEEIDYKSALDMLKKQRDDSLLLIKTEHQMRLDTANKLASYEEMRLQKFYENEISGLRKKIEEEMILSSKRTANEGIYRRHRMLMGKIDDHNAKEVRKDDSTLTLALSEDDIVDDLRFMVNEWWNVTQKCKIETECMVISLPGNRLIINNLFLDQNAYCVLHHGATELYGHLVGVDPKEFQFKPDKEKRKRFSLDLVRSGEIVLECPTSDEKEKLEFDLETETQEVSQTITGAIVSDSAQE